MSPELASKNTWNPKEAALWSGMPERTVYRLLRQGAVPCIPVGEPQTQHEKAGSKRWRTGKRQRTCYRFVIPRVAFMKWYKNVGPPETKRMGNPAA